MTVDENKIAFQRKRVTTRKAVEEEKKPIVKPQIPDDVVISSDGGEKVKQQPKPKGREGSSTKKEVRTLTSILTARSKVVEIYVFFFSFPADSSFEFGKNTLT